MYFVIYMLFFLLNDSTKVVHLNDHPIKINSITLKEIVTITNNGDGFYKTINITISPNDEVIVLDRGAKQIVVFDIEGRKIRSFGNEGNGPGEFTGSEGYIVAIENRIITKTRHKIMIFDYNGTLINEVKGEFRAAQLFEIENGFCYVADPGLAYKLSSVFYDENGEVLKEIKNSNYELAKKAQSLTFKDDVARTDEITEARFKLPLKIMAYNNGFVQTYQGNYKIEILNQLFQSKLQIYKKHQKIEDNYDYLGEKTRIANGFNTSEETRILWLSTAMKMANRRLELKNGFKDDIVDIIGESKGYLFLSVSSNKHKSEDERHFLIDVIAPDYSYLTQIDLTESGITNTNDVVWMTISRDKLIIELNNDVIGYHLKIVDIIVKTDKSISTKMKQTNLD